MKNSTGPLALSASFALALLLSLTQIDMSCAASYGVTALGTLNGYACSQATAVTNSGIVLTSNSGSAGNDNWAIWNPVTGLDIVPVSDDINVVRAINSSGVIVGQRNEDTAIMIDSNGISHDLPGITGSSGGWANAINDSGVVVGSCSYSAVLWQADGTPVALAGSLESYAVATAISDNGWVAYTQDNFVGAWPSVNRRLYIRKPDGSTQPLAQLSESEGIACNVSAVNDLGQAVGRTAGHAVLWNPDGSIAADLGIGAALDINNCGQIVGTLNGHPVMWDTDGSVVDILLPALCTWANAVSINDLGQIAGTVFYEAPGVYSSTAVLWQPVPEPASLLALVAGIAGLVIRRRR